MSDDINDNEYTYPQSDIEAAYNAFLMVDGIDTKLLSKETERKVKAIQRMAINIVYEAMKHINNYWIEEEKEEVS